MRLITRSDFDGLIAAFLLHEVEDISEMIFVHPKDVQDGLVKVTSDDILSNVPFVPGCGMWFDHHTSQLNLQIPDEKYKGACEVAPSAARVVYNYYKSEKFKKYDEVMIMVDKADSADLTADEILTPTGWILLSYIADARTGLGRFRDYRISNKQLMEKLVQMVRTESIETIMNNPDVQERVKRYFEQEVEFKMTVLKLSRQDRNVIITDFRGKPVPVGNRFLVYALFPETNISVRIIDGKKNEFVVVSVGHSIINKTSKTDVAVLMSTFGGGGHEKSGTCQVALDGADEKITAIIEEITRDG